MARDAVLPKRARLVERFERVIPEGDRAGQRLKVSVWRVPEGYRDTGKVFVEWRAEGERLFLRAATGEVIDEWHDEHATVRTWPTPEGADLYDTGPGKVRVSVIVLDGVEVRAGDAVSCTDHDGAEFPARLCYGTVIDGKLAEVGVYGGFGFDPALPLHGQDDDAQAAGRVFLPDRVTVTS